MNIKEFMKGRVSYYQGLNYLAAYAILRTSSLETAFSLVVTLLQREMIKYIGVDLVHVKKAFFIYERLIERLLPRLHRKFRQERITVDLFCTSWLLTVFSIFSQFDRDNPDLAEIWDIFIASGWPGMFRVLIAVIKQKEEALLNKNYEEIMNSLCSMPKLGTLNSGPQLGITQKFKKDHEDKILAENVSNEESPTTFKARHYLKSSFKEQIVGINITEATLKEIEDEHILIEKEIENTWTLLWETKY